MRFSSLPFLFGFLPITLAIYFAVPLRWRNLALLLGQPGVLRLGGAGLYQHHGAVHPH